MSDTCEALILTVFIVGTSIWFGGYIAIVVVARTATKTLDPGVRIAFFRSLGRSYFWVGLPALIVALAAGAVLARDLERSALLVTTAAVVVALLASFAVAVLQARRMTRLRRTLLESPEDERLTAQVRHGARAAGVMRAVLGLLTIALVVLGSFLAT